MDENGVERSETSLGEKPPAAVADLPGISRSVTPGTQKVKKKYAHTSKRDGNTFYSGRQTEDEREKRHWKSPPAEEENFPSRKRGERFSLRSQIALFVRISRIENQHTIERNRFIRPALLFSRPSCIFARNVRNFAKDPRVLMRLCVGF